MKKDLNHDLEVMDKCIRELSREGLEGKYKKSFRELKKKVLDEVNDIIHLYLTDPVIMKRVLEPEEIEALQGVVDGYREKIKKEIYEKRSANGFYETLAEAQSAVFSYIKEHGGEVDETALPKEGAMKNDDLGIHHSHRIRTDSGRVPGH
ncbi:MAG: hypothetical protein ACI4FX_07615 [Agathobacter sp.]